uniref:4-hydroxyphenylpyruvate dioxygenase n=1 Tax=Chromera velia CCMP2878 TaxID=1169474 RepID=A0A0G4GR19_9ALVE|eukprot:Cvel_5077.t1-p1 / transcript=Cvel_5077.t1 / gene=Cvel_5077 / organism=Chromera_velia_CCMP2878 / gene_product=4-hydroxyphenylpyruvate dioxygenase, putative / transcript_product=4-hydroxyphenylpyruvate dioxygenase, putative / location=Cvel_scaffold231:68347-70803(+) / protein_length=526 / sequence_SO=supercontig / SO=protein_coding / is_pseudo=false
MLRTGGALLLLLLTRTVPPCSAFRLLPHHFRPTNLQPRRRPACLLKRQLMVAGEKEQETTHIPSSAFARQNPLSDRFDVKCFHHIEIVCADARSTARYLEKGLGLRSRAFKNSSAGKSDSVSYLLQSGTGLRVLVTAPLQPPEGSAVSSPGGALESREGRDGGSPGEVGLCEGAEFLSRHGTAIRAVGVEVGSAVDAYAKCVQGGGEGVLLPAWFDADSGERLNAETASEVGRRAICISEVRLYGDVSLRFVSRSPSLSPSEELRFPGFVLSGEGDGEDSDFLLRGFDHVVGNVWDMKETMGRLEEMTGFHEFAEFTSEDVGTVDSGLNSVVLASNNERVLLPINEPTFGTSRKSQIQTYLEFNGGPGVQHVAIQCEDIFESVRRIRKAGLVDLMKRPRAEYYADTRRRMLREKVVEEGLIDAETLECAEREGVLVDCDDQGVLLQIFTTPLFDRPTLFFEFIERRGCSLPSSASSSSSSASNKSERSGEEEEVEKQAGGCGGFGKGNFRELFRKVEEFERERGYS